MPNASKLRIENGDWTSPCALRRTNNINSPTLELLQPIRRPPSAASSSSATSMRAPSVDRKMSRALELAFIRAYSRMPCLWQTSAREYQSKRLKSRAYEQLAGICRLQHRSAGRAFVVKKINSLRGSFRRARKRVQRNPNYRPQLWYYEMMAFTADVDDAGGTVTAPTDEAPQNDVAGADGGTTPQQLIEDGAAATETTTEPTTLVV